MTIRNSVFVLGVVIIMLGCGCSASANGNVEFLQGENKIDVLIDGANLTSYLYGGNLTKPILYPVKTTSGIVVNRGYPITKVEGESTDHPHHAGLFFTYDEVNGAGFWNNTTSPPQIKHIRVDQIEGGKDKGTLSTVMHWINKEGVVLLEEKRNMVFYPGKDSYAIDITADLTAKTKVEFGDTKEGMFAIRTADWMRESGGTGKYLSSNGDEKSGDIWGKRAKWVTIEGKKNDKVVGIAIMNHPSSVNYPTYWHARKYGLFSANPLGQLAFLERRKVENPTALGLKLELGQTAHFRFLIIIYEGNKTKQQLNSHFDKFAK